MSEFLVWSFSTVFNSWLFPYGCLIAAFFLYKNCAESYKLCAGLLFIEFLLCKIVAIVGLQLTDLLNPRGIYVAYCLIQVFCILAMFYLFLKSVNISLCMFLSVAAAGYVNSKMWFIYPPHSESFFGYSPKELYDIYPYLLGLIMLFELFFMTMFNKTVIRVFGRYGNTYTNVIDRMFMVISWSRLRYGLGLLLGGAK